MSAPTARRTWCACAYANGGVQTIAAAVTKPMAATTGSEMREVRMIV